jgi:DNA polymerase-3 subunit chi
MLPGTAATPAVLAASPVVLAESALSAPHQQVLVNLGGSVPEGFERFERLIEVVGPEDEDRQQGRRRWKHYADRGYAITRHDAAPKEAH